MQKPIFKYSIHEGKRYNFIKGSPLYEQLGVTLEFYDIETMDEVIEEVAQVLSGELVECDFSSGELNDFVLVLKEESRLYPVFEKDDYLKIPTKDLLEILKQWRDFISNPSLNNGRKYMAEINQDDVQLDVQLLDDKKLNKIINFSKLEKQFLKELEWFYRNYGNEWSLDDFSNKVRKNKEKLEKLLMYLSDQKIIKIDESDKYMFTVLKLPDFKQES